MKDLLIIVEIIVKSVIIMCLSLVFIWYASFGCVRLFSTDQCEVDVNAIKEKISKEIEDSNIIYYDDGNFAFTMDMDGQEVIVVYEDGNARIIEQ